MALTGVCSNSSLKGVNHMTICPIAIAVGCEKCPAFKFCPLITALGDQQEEDKVDSSDKFLEESFIVGKGQQITITGRNNRISAVERKLKRLEKVFDIWEKDFPQKKITTKSLKKNNQ